MLAARKKFLASRLGDLCLIGAMASLYAAFGTLDYDGHIFRRVRDAARRRSTPPRFFWSCAAMLKSAQFPLHGWLLEVMETPTPVSALLHAGIINAGGFLVLRFAPVIALSTARASSPGDRRRHHRAVRLGGDADANVRQSVARLFHDRANGLHDAGMRPWRLFRGASSISSRIRSTRRTRFCPPAASSTSRAPPGRRARAVSPIPRGSSSRYSPCCS